MKKKLLRLAENDDNFDKWILQTYIQYVFNFIRCTFRVDLIFPLYYP